MPDLSRRGFLSVIAMTPLVGLVPGQVEACIFRLFQGNTLVAGPFEREFRMNSTMQVRLHEGSHFTFDRMTLEVPSLDRTFDRQFPAINIIPAHSLDIDWTIRDLDTHTRATLTQGA